MGLGAGAFSFIINVRETLTDKEGMFRIPSYTTIIQPFSWSSKATFIVFKPGYASISGLNFEETLVKDADNKQVELPWLYNNDLRFIFAPRLTGLPKAKTREERWKSNMVDTGPGFRDKTPLLKGLIAEEDKALSVRGATI